MTAWGLGGRVWEPCRYAAKAGTRSQRDEGISLVCAGLAATATAHRRRTIASATAWESTSYSAFATCWRSTWRCVWGG